MDQQRSFETMFRIQHQHRDGSWAEMVEDRQHHDPADHDRERSWSKGRIFRCGSCPEVLTLIRGEGLPEER